MVSRSVPPAPRSDRTRKRAGRRPRGVQLIERDGYWHASGRLRIEGRSVRVRKSLGLAVKAASFEEADIECRAYVDELKARVTGKVGRGDPVAIAAAGYLRSSRERPLGPTTIRLVKEIVARFGPRRLNEIAPREWKVWIDGEHTERGFTPGRTSGRSASTRERILNALFGFLNYAKKEHGLAALPEFTRDKKARNPNRRVRRRVGDLRPDLIALLFDCAHIAIRAQLAVEKATGARVSSVLYAARLCDLNLAEGREQLVFPKTKNGEDVPAALDATAVQVLKEYLTWRGRLHDREGPLFLTPRKRPYTFNGRDGGGQNKTGFKGARRRAVKILLERSESQARALEASGRGAAAADARDRARADAELLGKVTQHWFRHRLATMLQHAPRAGMEQGGWLDIRSFTGYTHDVPEQRRALINQIDDLADSRSAAAARRK